MVHPEFAYLGDDEDDKKVDMGSNRGKRIPLEKAKSPCPRVSSTMRWGCLAMSIWGKIFMMEVSFSMCVQNGVLFDAQNANRGKLFAKGVL